MATVSIGMKTVLARKRSCSAMSEENAGKSFDLALLVNEKERAFWIALRVTKSSSLAEDAVQEAYAALLCRPPQYRGDELMKNFFFTVVRKQALMVMRGERNRKKREEASAAETPLRREESPATGTGGELAEAARTALNLLPLAEREAVSMCCEQNFSHQRAAEILGVPKRTLTHRVNRGLEKLRKILTQQGYAVATPLAVGAALSSLPLLPVPHTLTATLLKLAANPPAAKTETAYSSAKTLSVASTKKAATHAGRLTVTVTVAAVVSVGVMAGIWWRQSGGTPTGEAKQVAIAPAEKTSATPADNFSFTWNFNDGKLPMEFKVVEGQVKVLSNGGVEDSGCLSVESQLAVILLDMPAAKLPVVVSFQNQLLPPRVEGGYYAFARWEAAPIVDFNNVGTLIMSKAYSLQEVACYLNESASDLWVDGRRTNLRFTLRLPNARLGLAFRGRQLVDNITVQTLAPDQAPDVQPYLAALAKIEPNKRLGTVILPGLKGDDPSKPVTATFGATENPTVTRSDVKGLENKK
jgi:RNA polymerase sigma-70 factor (ECF subfamily)